MKPVLISRPTTLAAALFPALALVLGAGAALPARAQLVVGGSPGYDSTTLTGHFGGGVGSPRAVNSSGVAVGYAATTRDGSTTNRGSRAVRWDASGNADVLGLLGTDSSGWTNSRAVSVNDAGTAVGNAQKYVGGTYLGTRAVRWNASDMEATELGNLGTSNTGATHSQAYAVNASGTAVGYANKHEGGTSLGSRAVRWNAWGTVATELENLGTSGTRYNSCALAISDTGITVGYANKYEGVINVGTRALRWTAWGSVTELGNLGTSGSGYTLSSALAVNDTGTAVGYASEYLGGVWRGERAVRWDASGTDATELGNLGTTDWGGTMSAAYALNRAGTAVGYALKYVGGVNLGDRAVRWDAGGTAATELGNLGTHTSGVTSSRAFAVNEAGTAVGTALKYDEGGTDLGSRAVAWLPNASVVDLNDLGVVPNPTGGSWLLTSARALSADGWAAGTGTFTPDVGDPYVRHWVGQIGLGGAWLNTSGENHAWGRGPNWSTGTPAIQLDALFDAPAAYSVGFDRNEQARDIVVADGDVTFALGAFDLTVASALTIRPGARLSSDGTLIGQVQNYGVLSPGNSPGPLTIVGDLINPGVLEFEIASTSLFDSLEVTGLLDLDGGMVAIVLLDGFMPSEGDLFPLLSFGSLTGTFGFDFSQAALGPGLEWDTSNLLTSGALGVAQMPGADSAVPEPGSATLLGLAAGAAWLRRRRMNGRRQPGRRRG